MIVAICYLCNVLNLDHDYEPCNSMELIYISELVIYFSSSINEECVALKTPYIDIKVDMSKNRFPFYYDNKYGIEVGLAYLMRFFPKILNHLLYHSIVSNYYLVMLNFHSLLNWILVCIRIFGLLRNYNSVFF